MTAIRSKNNQHYRTISLTSCGNYQILFQLPIRLLVDGYPDLFGRECDIEHTEGHPPPLLFRYLSEADWNSQRLQTCREVRHRLCREVVVAQLRQLRPIELSVLKPVKDLQRPLLRRRGAAAL